jgi:hypothetical protein
VLVPKTIFVGLWKVKFIIFYSPVRAVALYFIEGKFGFCHFGTVHRST